MAQRRPRDDPLLGVGGLCLMCRFHTATVALINSRGEACHTLCAGCFSATVSTDALRGTSDSGARCPICSAALSGFRSFTQEEISASMFGVPLCSAGQARAPHPPPPQQQQQRPRPVAATPPPPPPPAAAVAPPAPPPPAVAAPALPPAADTVFCHEHKCACGIVRAKQRGRTERLVFQCQSCSTVRFGVKGALALASGEGGANRGVPHCACKKPMAYRVSNTRWNPQRPFYCCALKNGKHAGCDCWMWAQGPARRARQCRRARADADDLHGLASWGKVGGMTLGSLFFGYEMPCGFDELDDDCYTDDD